LAKEKIHKKITNQKFFTFIIIMFLAPINGQMFLSHLKILFSDLGMPLPNPNDGIS
jgi:hypothetical protein